MSTMSSGFCMLACDYIYGIMSSEVIKGNGKQIPQVVKLWVERYEADPKPAMVELLLMLFEVVRFSLSLFNFHKKLSHFFPCYSCMDCMGWSGPTDISPLI